jgi:hypothetical protein
MHSRCVSQLSIEVGHEVRAAGKMSGWTPDSCGLARIDPQLLSPEKASQCKIARRCTSL